MKDRTATSRCRISRKFSRSWSLHVQRRYTRLSLCKYRRYAQTYIWLSSTYWDAMQCVAVCCSVLQCIAVCCSPLHIDMWCSVLQCVAERCSVLQCVAVCCSPLHIDMWCVLQCVAECCSVLQCIAVCCSPLHIDINNTYHIRTEKQNASARRLLPATLLERWPQVFRVKITFESLRTTSFVSTKTNSMKCFVNWIPLNLHVRLNKIQPCLEAWPWIKIKKVSKISYHWFSLLKPFCLCETYYLHFTTRCSTTVRFLHSWAKKRLITGQFDRCENQDFSGGKRFKSSPNPNLCPRFRDMGNTSVVIAIQSVDWKYVD